MSKSKGKYEKKAARGPEPVRGDNNKKMGASRFQVLLNFF